MRCSGALTLELTFRKISQFEENLEHSLVRLGIINNVLIYSHDMSQIIYRVSTIACDTSTGYSKRVGYTYGWEFTTSLQDAPGFPCQPLDQQKIKLWSNQLINERTYAMSSSGKILRLIDELRWLRMIYVSILSKQFGKPDPKVRQRVRQYNLATQQAINSLEDMLGLMA